MTLRFHIQFAWKMTLVFIQSRNVLKRAFSRRKAILNQIGQNGVICSVFRAVSKFNQQFGGNCNTFASAERCRCVQQHSQEEVNRWIFSLAVFGRHSNVSGESPVVTFRNPKCVSQFELVLFWLFRSSLVIRFGLILNDLITCRVGLIGAILNVGYICCFLYYSNDKNKSQALTKIGYGAALVVAILAYTFIENPNDMPLRFGLLFTVLIFLVVGSPLLGLVWFYSWTLIKPKSNCK